MQMVLESTLISRETALLSHDSSLRILLVYEDSRFVNAATELLINAIRRMATNNRCHCAMCQSDLLMEPLLVRVAVDEVSAADILILIARSDMPHKGHDWATLWFWTHPPVRTQPNCENPDRIAQGKAHELEKIGTLDTVDLFTLGGDDSPGTELKNEMRRTLPSVTKSIPCARGTPSEHPPTPSPDARASPGKGVRNHGNPVHAA